MFKEIELMLIEEPNSRKQPLASFTQVWINLSPFIVYANMDDLCTLSGACGRPQVFHLSALGGWGQ